MPKNIYLVLMMLQLTISVNASTNVSAAGAEGYDDSPQTFVDLGLLYTQDDFDRMQAQVTRGPSPWKEGWERSIKNLHSAQSWTPCPQTAVYRDSDSLHTENYGRFYNDAAAAYALALRWKGSDDDTYADRAVTILDSWSETLMELGGNGEKILSSSLYGYQFANAAEIMRDYKKWPASRQKRFQEMMVTIFYPMNHDFLVRRNGSKADHYRTNWDLANMASMAAIGVLADRRDIYDEAIGYFKHGAGNKVIKHSKRKNPSQQTLVQPQKSAHDHSHDALLTSLLSAFCQEHDDLSGDDNNRRARIFGFLGIGFAGLPLRFPPYPPIFEQLAVRNRRIDQATRRDQEIPSTSNDAACRRIAPRRHDPKT